MPYIECHHCNKIIHNVSILKDITLNLDRNKIYGFIGHNGCGKTMLFKLLTGMISASGERYSLMESGSTRRCLIHKN